MAWNDGRGDRCSSCYPMTGQPGKALPAGWDDIPGARGCTPETCGFRDHHKDLAKLHADVYGVSTQSTAYQQEMVKRLQVPRSEERRVGKECRSRWSPYH